MEKELFTSNIRKFHETETVKKIPDISLYALLSKQFLYLLKGKPFLYFYKRKLFSYFRKQNLVLSKPKPKKQKNYTKKKFFVFQEMELSSSHIKKSHFSRN